MHSTRDAKAKPRNRRASSRTSRPRPPFRLPSHGPKTLSATAATPNQLPTAQFASPAPIEFQSSSAPRATPVAESQIRRAFACFCVARHYGSALHMCRWLPRPPAGRDAQGRAAHRDRRAALDDRQVADSTATRCKRVVCCATRSYFRHRRKHLDAWRRPPLRIRDAAFAAAAAPNSFSRVASHARRWSPAAHLHKMRRACAIHCVHRNMAARRQLVANRIRDSAPAAFARRPAAASRRPFGDRRRRLRIVARVS